MKSTIIEILAPIILLTILILGWSISLFAAAGMSEIARNLSYVFAVIVFPSALIWGESNTIVISKEFLKGTKKGINK